MSPDEWCDRVRMCLVEAGYPHAVDQVVWSEAAQRPCFTGNTFGISRRVGWKAMTLAGNNPGLCWPCVRDGGVIYVSDIPEPCGHPVDPFCPEDAEAVS